MMTKYVHGLSYNRKHGLFGLSPTEREEQGDLQNASVESNNTFFSLLLLAIFQLSQLLRKYGQKGNQYRGGRAQAPKVITKKQHTYIIPSFSLYFSNPEVLFELYKPSHNTTTKSKQKQTPPPSSSQTPPSSSNLFDSLEQEQVEHFRVIIPTKYKKKAKKPLPNPSLCKGSQVTVSSRSTFIITSTHEFNETQV
jgi:hypothetical protein